MYRATYRLLSCSRSNSLTSPFRTRFCHIAERWLITVSLFILLTVSLSLTACSKRPQQHEYTLLVFGTLVDVTMYDVDRKLAEETFRRLQALFEKNHEDWSPWSDGDLAKLNEQLKRTGTVIRVPDHLFPLIASSIELSTASGGLFNPAIGNLINLWQFHRYQEENIHPPDPQQIQQLLDQDPKMTDLTLGPQHTLINSNRSVSLNFGAFAKGYAIERALRVLKESDIDDAIINAGGDLSVIGQHGDRAWNIGIRHPRKDDILASVEVADGESVFTSGDYERFYYYEGRRYHHILDPRTGYPTDDARSVTVIHHDAAVADAAATALFIAGRDGWQAVAEKMGISYVMLVDSEGTIHLTESMQKRVKILDKYSTSRIIVSEAL